MNIAIIPAAGKGVRFRELGAHYPKCLLPFEGQSLIVKTIKQLQPLMDVIYIVVLDDSHQLWDMIRRMDKVQMVLVDQNLPQGPATSIYCGLKHAAENYPHVMAQDVMPLEGTSVTVVLSDAHYNLDFGSIIRRGYSLVTCMSVKDWSRWCMARVDEEAGGLFLYDKPVDRVPAARALSGVYHFDDGTGAYESFRRAVTLRGSGDADEPQISTALLLHTTTEISTILNSLCLITYYSILRLCPGPSGSCKIMTICL